MDAVQGQLITGLTADTATVITLTDINTTIEERAFYMKVISGTVKYGRHGVHASAHGWTSAADAPPILCKNGELYVSAADAGDTFVVTCI